MDINNQYGTLQRQMYYLPMMDDIHRFCISNRINYSLSGGSLLGAVRHKGFIPWDDDIDIMFDRENYERFIECFTNEPIPGYMLLTGFYVTRVSKIDNELASKEEQCIDLFVLDSIPNSVFAEKIKLFAIEILQGMLKKQIDYKKYSSKDKILVFGTHFLGLFFTASMKKKMFDSVAKWGDSPDAKFLNMYNTFFSQIKKTRFPREVLSSYLQVDFEGRQYMSISGYDQYLKETYGDYMQLPPEDERIPRHSNE